MSRAQTLAKTRAQSRKPPEPKAPRGTGAFLAGKNLNIVLCVLLATATIALYSPVFGYGFVILDDQEYVTGNPHVQNGLAWSTIKWAFTSTETAAYWHPLTWLSHALDYQLFALDPAGHHFHNVLIHALNAVLLFLLLQWVTRRVAPSLLVAALFAVHPLNVESVAWVAERKNVLSTLFFLLAIGAYVRYVRKPDWHRYLLVAALFAAGLMAKPMVTTLPFVLLLLDYWPLNRTTLDETGDDPATINGVQRVGLWRLALEKVPLLLLSAASARITLIAQGRVEFASAELPFGLRVENAVVSYGLYLWKMLWPARLAAFYPHPRNTLPMWQVIFSALILIAVTALVIVFRRKRYLPVGWFWYLGTLVPVIGLVQVWKQAMADRFAYIPLIGIFIMIAWGLDDWAEAKRISKAWRVIPALCVLMALCIVTSRQITYWESQYDLWSRSLAVAENPFAHNALASALIVPGAAMSPRDLENFDTDQKRLDEARRHFERVLEQCRQQAQWGPDVCLPEMATALSNLGVMHRSQNRPEETLREDYEEALKIDRQLDRRDPLGRYRSYLAGTLLNLAGLDLLQNRIDESRQHYEEALQTYRQLAQQDPGSYLPDMAGILANLGALERSQKRMDQAELHFEEALEIDRRLAQQDPGKYLPDLANRLLNLGNFDTERNRIAEARPRYEEALDIYRQLAQRVPDMYLADVAGTLDNLAILDENQNRVEDAHAHYQESLTLFRKLAQGNPVRYASEVARVEASLEKLDRKGRSR